MKRILYIMLWCLMTATAVMADNQAEQLYESADAAYAKQDYKEAARLAKEALPLCKGT